MAPDRIQRAIVLAGRNDGCYVSSIEPSRLAVLSLQCYSEAPIKLKRSAHRRWLGLWILPGANLLLITLRHGTKIEVPARHAPQMCKVRDACIRAGHAQRQFENRIAHGERAR